MIASFSTPVLSIAADTFKDLEGRDAISSLCTLFTKCKESLQDGRRLENISWRMWYREMAAAAPSYRPPTPEPSSPTLSEAPQEFPFFMSAGEKSIHRNEPAQQSLPSINERHVSPSLTANHPQDRHPSSEIPSMPSPCPSLSLSLSFGRPKKSPSVGQFIVDMLPHNANFPVRSPQRSKAARENVHPVTHPAISLPAVRLPPTPTLADSFPRVVVVNPTPHPTPPATPILRNTTSPAQFPSTHLLPPLPSPALMTLNPSTDQRTTSSAAQLSSPRVPWVSKPAATPDETLKASDRRFFLQQSPEGESPECDGSTDGGKATFSDVVEVSSGGSSQMQSKGSAESVRPAVTKSTRKGKEALRHVGVGRPCGRRGHITRPGIKRQISADGSKHRPTFNIGSSSSNGSKGAQNGDGSSSSKVAAPPPPKETVPNPAKTAHIQGRRIVVASSASSEYETDSDDDSWCSEEMSAEENEKKKEDIRLREAALEAQRQRDMFAKVPKRSYSNLDRSRSGLLSTLLNPDPNIFPPNHPYRSSQDVAQLPRRAGFTPMTPLTTSKGSAAIPQASQATARAPSTNGTNHRSKSKDDGGYQPKGRPQGQEMEDDSDSDADDRIQLSRSVAQERLAALASRRGIERSQSSRPPQPAVDRPVLPTVTSAPVPFGHPYNLPAPAPPSTPRTTRRQMLSTELSESLRRNLLWERQVSKNAMVRRQSATILSGGLRPLTSLTAGESSRHDGHHKPSTSHEGRDERAENEDRKRRAMARNRSWADDYHYSGW